MRDRAAARLAGVCYLVTIVAGVFAEVGVRGRVVVADDAGATAANIHAHEFLFRCGLAADLIMLVAYLGVTLLLYVLFQPVRSHASLFAAFFSVTGIAVLAVNSMTHVAPLLLLRPSPYLAAFNTSQLQSLALFALKLHARGYAISGVFFGIYCITIGWLTSASNFLPRFLGWLMMMGGAAYVISSFVGFLWPATAARLPDVTVIGLAELAFALWLTVVGLRAHGRSA